MLVEKNIVEADDVVQVGLYKDPEHTDLNVLQVSTKIPSGSGALNTHCNTFSGFGTLSTYCLQDLC